VRFFNSDGASAPRCFVVGNLDEQLEKEPNDSPDKAKGSTSFPSRSTVGWKKPTTAIPLRPFEQANGWWRPSMPTRSTLPGSHGASSRQRRNQSGVQSRWPNFGSIACVQSGQGWKFILELAAFAYPPKSEVRFTGSEAAVYRITISLVVARYAFPTGVQRGRKTVSTFSDGTSEKRASCFTGIDASIWISAPTRSLWRPSVENRLSVPVGEAPEVIEIEPNDTMASAQPVSIPCTINGRIDPGRPRSICVSCEERRAGAISRGIRTAWISLDATLKVEDQRKELARSDDTDVRRIRS